MSEIVSNSIKILNVSDGSVNIDHRGDLPSPPTEGLVPGVMYYDTTKKKSFIYDGNEWKVVAADGAAGSGVLDMRYGDGETFTYETDANGKKINIGITEGSWVGYKIVPEIPADSAFLDENNEIIQAVYDSYGWNKNDVAFGVKYFI